MTDAFLFELVTPEKLAYSGDASMVEVPGEMGDFGVLVGHAPFFSMIRPGVITVHEGEAQQRFFVPSGYAEVNPEGCRVLAEHMTDLSVYTKEEAEAHLVSCESALKDCATDKEKMRAQVAIDHAKALLEVI